MVACVYSLPPRPAEQCVSTCLLGTLPLQQTELRNISAAARPSCASVNQHHRPQVSDVAIEIKKQPSARAWVWLEKWQVGQQKPQMISIWWMQSEACEIFEWHFLRFYKFGNSTFLWHVSRHLRWNDLHFSSFALQQIYAAFPSRCGDIHNTIACFTRRWITPRTHFIPNHHTVTCSYPVNCGCIHAQKPIKYVAFALFIFEFMSKRISKCSHSVLFYESKLFGIKVELKSEFVNQNGPFQSHVSHWS